LGDLALEYSTDNGSNWLSITPLTPAAPGSYAWLVPGTATTQGLVRASSANVPAIFDDSDQNFIIPFEFTQKHLGGAFDGFALGVNQTPTLTLTSPIGGEVWAASSVQNITWSQTALSSVKIDYSTDNGSTWNLVAANANATVGSFAWLVPADYTVNARIRIEDAFNSVLSDISAQVFVIPAEFSQKYNGGIGRGDVKGINTSANLVLSYPDLFENIPGSSQVQIAWMANTVADINIDYSINNGSSWINIISNTPANTGLFTWSVPNVNTTQGLVRISDALNPSITFDISAQTFTITSPIADKHFGGNYDGHASAVNQPPSISVTYPNGGEVLFSGDVVQIAWSSTNVQKVDLEFSSNSGSSWTTISTQEPAPLGSYVWSIPVGVSGLGLIRITDSGNLLVRDTSNAVFTLPLEFASKFQGGAGDGYAADINSTNDIQLMKYSILIHSCAYFDDSISNC
jgi:hypothetical protein